MDITLTSSDWTIIYGKDELTTDDELTIDYNANVAAQSERISATNIGLVQITLDWASNAPIISGVTNGQKINVVSGESFELPEATATSYDGLTVLDVTVSGADEVNTSVAGTYAVTYTATDEDNGSSKTVTIYIVVADIQAPIIYGVTDGQSFSLNYGDSYTEPFVTATNYDGSEDIDVVVSGDTVNSSESGSYSVTYTATDTTLGLSTSVTIKIVVYGEVINNIYEYYTYTYDDETSGYKVAMTSDFQTAVNSENGTLTVNNEDLWTTGDTLPNPGSTYEGEPVTSMDSMFKNCDYIASLDLSGWDTSNVADMSSMFYACDTLLSLEGLSNWETGEVINMYSMFRETYVMTSAGDLSNWDTGKVTNMYKMFYDCWELTYVGDLSNWDTEEVTTMYRMFGCCEEITFLGSLSDWDTSNVNTMDSMFDDCEYLMSLDLSKWDTGKVTSMYKMFEGCEALTSVGDLSDWDTGSVTSMCDMFTDCEVLISVGDLSDWDTGKVTYMNFMFAGCKNLTSLDLSGWDTGEVAYMNSMFAGCETLTSLDLSGWDMSGVTKTSSMFSSCSSLATIYARTTDDADIFNNVHSYTCSYYIGSLDSGSCDFYTTD